MCVIFIRLNPGSSACSLPLISFISQKAATLCHAYHLSSRLSSISSRYLSILPCVENYFMSLIIKLLTQVWKIIAFLITHHSIVIDVLLAMTIDYQHHQISLLPLLQRLPTVFESLSHFIILCFYIQDGPMLSMYVFVYSCAKAHICVINCSNISSVRNCLFLISLGVLWFACLHDPIGDKFHDQIPMCDARMSKLRVYFNLEARHFLRLQRCDLCDTH